VTQKELFYPDRYSIYLGQRKEVPDEFRSHFSFPAKNDTLNFLVSIYPHQLK